MLSDIGVFIRSRQVPEEVRRVMTAAVAAALIECSCYRLRGISKLGVDIGKPIRRQPKEAAIGI